MIRRALRYTLAITLLCSCSMTALASPPPVMTDEEKVGQLFMIALDTEIAAQYEPYIKSGRLGGGLLRWDKFTKEQALAFTSLMQTWALSSKSRVPFLIAADHEGGSHFTQLSYHATLFPGNMALGATGSEKLTEQAAKISGQELRALGISVNFAPVIDINNNPDNPIIGVRSFGEDPALVATLGAAAVRGYLSAGIAPVAKHFPGHGDTKDDSHEMLPIIDRSLEQLDSVELAPFKAAIAAGVPMIMPAHILFPALEKNGLPVTLSTSVIEGLLRGKLGFKGVVVTDSMDMGAIAKKYGTPEASVMAVRAGCDLILLGKGDFLTAYAAVLKAVKDGVISQERLNLSVERILDLKKKLGLPEQPEPPLASVGQKENQECAQKIAEQSLTLVRNEESLIPLRLNAQKKLFATIFHSPRSSPEITAFITELKARHLQTQVVDSTAVPDDQTTQEILKQAKKADVLLIGTFHGQGVPAAARAQTQLVRRLLALKKPIILVSLLNPYDLQYFSKIKTALCTYGVTAASLDALLRVIFGEIKPQGKLPVTIPGFAKRGDGWTGVLTGIDVLEQDGFHQLQGKRVGLITNQTGQDRFGQSTVDVLAKAPGVTLAAIFSPEHGFTGTHEDGKVSSGTILVNGRTIPLISLYAGGMAGMRPKQEDLKGLDVLVFDIQDIGVRFYTYLATMGMALEETKKAHIPFIVLDRPNPIGGTITEGPLPDAPILRRRETVYFNVPVRHGMTAGEIALYYNHKIRHPALTVIRMQGWSRAMWHDDTNLPWTPPSPNMPNLEAAAFYPGIGLFEPANLSVGRGTSFPFRWIGAPWLDAQHIVALLQKTPIPGVVISEQDCTPSKNKYAGQLCHGLKLTMTDRLRLRPLTLFLRLERAIRKTHPHQFQWDWHGAGLMTGTRQFERLLKRNAALHRLQALFDQSARQFEKKRMTYLLY